jgi:hypothetical protein
MAPGRVHYAVEQPIPEHLAALLKELKGGRRGVPGKSRRAAMGMESLRDK